MEIEIIMPKMGESITEGTIIAWHKKIGDPIKKDEIIFEISTDKVDTEIPAPADGILSEILAEVGSTLEVGKIVAKMKSTESSVPQSPIRITESVKPENTEYSTIDIPMPKMGESIMEGTILRWHKKVGESIKRDEILFEISTDKVDAEIPSPVDGIVIEILANETETLSVGETVARLKSNTGISLTSEEKIMEQKDNLQTTVTEIRGKEQAKESPKLNSSTKFYSPLVLSIAEKEGIALSELSSIRGTGVDGRVSKKDILGYIELRNAPVVTKSPVLEIPQGGQVYPGGAIERVTMDNIRQKIMHHMIESRDTSVHVTGVVEVDMYRISRYLEKHKDEFYLQNGIKLTYLTFVSYAVIKALSSHPLLNSSIDGNEIIRKKFINLGIAVALENNGLIVPNIKNAQDKNLAGIARSIMDVASRAKLRKLTADDITGGTFTITNYGVFGTLIGTPIINQPEVAILGMGAVVKKPVVVDIDGNELIAIRPMMYLTLSHDHRLVDGMAGGRFLADVKNILENFTEI
ncbi:MAG: 2-oxo acid dehydrogenase subunit E2 [Ignavibacteria bacterium]|nr:2-oxo acid dehydrogenase subunit E2 [Ignavibacteria bacterium]